MSDNAHSSTELPSGSADSAEAEQPLAPAPQEASQAPPAGASEKAAKEKGKKKKKKKDKKKKEKGGIGSSRGIETMFRTSYRTHMDLSALADNKANIMISINGIMMTIMISVVVPNVYDTPSLLVPSAVLLVTSLVSIIYAVLCARPRVSSNPVSLEDVRDNRTNILFFGNFVNMEENDYVEGMIDLMREPDRIYYNMTRDIYGLGKVLHRKFRLLRVSYTVFMIGLVLTVSSYVLVLLSGGV